MGHSQRRSFRGSEAGRYGFRIRVSSGTVYQLDMRVGKVLFVVSAFPLDLSRECIGWISEVFGFKRHIYVNFI
jgi:hypothetical protein